MKLGLLQTLVVGMAVVIMVICTDVALGNPKEVFLEDVKRYVGTADSACIVIRVTPQPFYGQLNFVTIDTGCSDSFHPRPGYRPMRLALDSLGRPYKLFGFDTLEFDELASQQTTAIDIDNVYEFGKFYLEMTRIYEFREYAFITDSDQLLTLNRDEALFWARSEDEFKKRSRDVAKRISKIAPNWNLNNICYNTHRMAFSVDYYVWYSDTGDIRHFSLEIGRNGSCALQADEVVAKAMGYNHPVNN